VVDVGDAELDGVLTGSLWLRAGQQLPDL